MNDWTAKVLLLFEIHKFSDKKHLFCTKKASKRTLYLKEHLKEHLTYAKRLYYIANQSRTALHTQ